MATATSGIRGPTACTFADPPWDPVVHWPWPPDGPGLATTAETAKDRRFNATLKPMLLLETLKKQAQALGEPVQTSIACDVSVKLGVLAAYQRQFLLQYAAPRILKSSRLTASEQRVLTHALDGIHTLCSLTYGSPTGTSPVTWELMPPDYILKQEDAGAKRLGIQLTPPAAAALAFTWASLQLNPLGRRQLASTDRDHGLVLRDLRGSVKLLLLPMCSSWLQLAPKRPPTLQLLAALEAALRCSCRSYTSCGENASSSCQPEGLAFVIKAIAVVVPLLVPTLRTSSSNSSSGAGADCSRAAVHAALASLAATLAKVVGYSSHEGMIIADSTLISIKDLENQQGICLEGVRVVGNCYSTASSLLQLSRHLLQQPGQTKPAADLGSAAALLASKAGVYLTSRISSLLALSVQYGTPSPDDEGYQSDAQRWDLRMQQLCKDQHLLDAALREAVHGGAGKATAAAPAACPADLQGSSTPSASSSVGTQGDEGAPTAAPAAAASQAHPATGSRHNAASVLGWTLQKLQRVAHHTLEQIVQLGLTRPAGAPLPAAAAGPGEAAGAETGGAGTTALLAAACGTNGAVEHACQLLLRSKFPHTVPAVSPATQQLLNPLLHAVALAGMIQQAGSPPLLLVGCGNRHCSNLSGASEVGLVAYGKKSVCGGCRAVAYCGADCQQWDWVQGHNTLCGEVAAQLISTD